MTFSEKLRELRDECGLSEARLAQRAGMPYGTLHNYSLQVRTPTFKNMLLIAQALGVDVNVFAACDEFAPTEADV